MDKEEYRNSTSDSDDLRPLTVDGIRKMKKIAKGLRKFIDRPDALISSPLTRALQTAEILEGTWMGLEIELRDELRPETHPEKLELFLRSRDEWMKKKAVVTIVGHEPHLSHVVSYFLAGAQRSLIELKKGGACLIEFDGPPRKSRGTLQWLVTGKWV